MTLAATSALFALLLVPQAQDPVLAHYEVDGRAAVVTRTDLAIEMAFQLRRRDRGRQAASQLADTLLTRRAAEKKGLMPTVDEARAFWKHLQEQLRAAGRRPEEFAAVRNTGEAQWLDDLAVQMAQERLVREEVGLGNDEPVGGEMLKLWLQEERKRVPVQADPDQLPAGVAVRVGTEDVPIVELGFLLVRTAEDEERDRYVRQFVLIAVLEQACKQAGVTATAADFDAAVQKRAADAARDPRNRGVTFDNLLKAEGLTTAALRELRSFRAHVLVEKLATTKFPTAGLLEELRQDRGGVLALVGPRRRIALVFLNALDPPNAVVTRSFEAAERELLALRDRMQTAFGDVALTTSEHPSRQHRGDTGWHRRRSDGLPEPVLKAAFELGPEQLSVPLRGPDGVFVVKVLETEADPTDDVLIERLREFHSQELSQRLLHDAKIRMGNAKTPEGGK